MLRTVLCLMGEHDRNLRAGGPGLAGHIVAGAPPAPLPWMQAQLIPPGACQSHASVQARSERGFKVVVRLPSLLNVHAELADIDNEPLVRMVGGDRVCTVNSHDIIGRLMIQCARQPGLAAVWEQIMVCVLLAYCRRSPSIPSFAVLQGSEGSISATSSTSGDMLGQRQNEWAHNRPHPTINCRALWVTSFTSQHGRNWRAAPLARRCSCSRMLCHWASNPPASPPPPCGSTRRMTTSLAKVEDREGSFCDLCTPLP